MSNAVKYFLAAVGIVAVGIGLFFTFCLHWVNVDGSERVVWQSYDGVEKEIAKDGLHWYCPVVTTPHRYEISTQRFVIDDQTINPINDYITDEEKKSNQPDMEPLTVPVQMDKLTPKDLADGRTTGPTDLLMRCSMQYHLDDNKLVDLHNEKRASYVHNFLADVVRKTIIDETTVLDARTVYQGGGRVTLQLKIEDSLKNNELFNHFGIVVENFVIRKIDLKDTDFLKKITDEARAEQDRKTANKQKLAYMAQAEAEKEKAIAEQNRRLVEADTQKNEFIKKAEASKKQQILAAEAGAEQARLEGEGIKLKKIAEAEGVLALGKAEAESQRLKLRAYEGEGGARFAEVQKAQAFGEAIQHVQYIPSNMQFVTVARDFLEAVKGLPSSDPAPAK